MAKKKKKFPIFVITLVIGFGLIGYGVFLDVDAITQGTFVNVLLGGQLTGFSIISVPIDPTTGGILGTIVLGAPDVVPFEQSGTHISTISPTCTTDFGRRLSGERNLDPVWWASQPVSVGSISKHCAYAYAQWDVTEIPNDFVATSVQFQLELVDNTPMSGLNCLITFNDFNIDTVPEATLINKLRITPQLILEGRPSSFPNTPDFVQDPNGAWCRTLGVKTFNFGQTGVDIVNNAIGGGTFDQGVRNDKLVLGFVPSDLGSNDGFAQQYRISNQFWATEGSWKITGSSPPIRCDVGFAQVEFRCVPIICAIDQTLNTVTNQCETIVCEVNEDLTIFEEQIGCITVCIDDPLTVNIIECGSACPDTIQRAVCVPQETIPPDDIPQCQVELNCQEGTTPTASGCSCELIECPTGQELINDQCQAIQCQVNTFLSGNDCLEIQCPAGQISSNNECVPETTLILCVEGFQQVGDQCVPIDLECPIGTEPFENNCRQIVPDLLMVRGVDPSLFLITGLVIAGMSGVGIVARRRG
ncbi:MAG: hypothetical protein KJI69_03230 [Patescibacteria group bacterium]|nr:hypothetical protein [Patescibacteria group bacterium]